MTAAATLHLDPRENELTPTRLIHAPRTLVFKAFTDRAHLAQWWGPQGFTNPVCELDVQPGGHILIHMRAPDGVVYPMTGVYHEIVEPERLVFTSVALDEKGNTLFEVLNTIAFAEEEGKTTLIIHASVRKATPEAAPYLKGMDEGWKQTIDRLEEHMALVSR